MKKTNFFLALAVAAGLSSCGAKAPKAQLNNSVDSLSYAIGMARTDGLTQYLAQQGIDSTQMSSFLKGFNEGSQKLDKSDDAYLAGLQIGHMVSKQWLESFNKEIFGTDSTQTLNRQDLLAGFVAGVMKDNKNMSLEAAQKMMEDKMKEVKDAALLKQYGANKEAGEKFLAENKKKEGVVTLPSGLQYKVLKEGKGEIPADTSVVKVNYKGTLIDGKVFDSSYERKEPAIFNVNQVIPGWTEALKLMPVGSKWELYIPYNLAYGERQAGPDIKPFSALVFEVDLLGIEKHK